MTNLTNSVLTVVILHVECLNAIYLKMQLHTLTPLQLLNMRTQPVPAQLFNTHILGPRNPSQTFPLPRTTSTVKRLSHIPLRTRVKERKRLPLLQRPIVHNPDLHFVHIEDERRRAGVVNEDEVGVELDMCVRAGLHGGVGFGGWGCGGNFGEEGTGREVGLGDGGAGEGFGTAMHIEEVRVGFDGRGGGGSGGFDCHWRHFWRL